MGGEFRESAWALSDSLADDEAFAALEARPMHETSSRLLRALTVEVNSNAVQVAGAELKQRGGFRYLGTAKERIRGVLYRPSAGDTFVDAHETTYVIVKPRRQLLPLSRYYIITIFDGSCLETVSRTESVPSEGPLLIRTGHDDLERDVAEHLSAVRERAIRGQKVIPVRNLDDVARLKRFYYSHVISPTLAGDCLEAGKYERELLKLALVALAVIGAIVWWAVKRFS